ncbi:hypothetical protein C8Q79DRAFT_929567 [Trametes meyenii]|nr:hypothetical protein C8Q79DRAFT_929567 [Trametes meyenii]
MPALQLALVALSFASSASAQYSTGRHRGRRLVGGAIAGIVIGALGQSGWRRFGAGRGPAAQEAGYGPGPNVGPQGGWNTNAQPAYDGAYGGGQYQPPAGPPPNGPQPGGFIKPPAAHTRPY